MSPATRANPPRLDPGGTVVGEDAPGWVVAAIVAVGAGLVAAGVWLVGGAGTAVEADAPAPRPGVTLSMPSGMSSSSASTAPVVTAAAVTAATDAPAPTTTTIVPATPATSVAAACPSAIAIWFPVGSATPVLDPASLTPMVRWLLDDPDARVVVRGHASAVGDDQANLLLSYQRALQISAVLRAGGVPDGRITVRAAGALEPVSDNPADPTNQRVVVAAATEDCGAP